MNLIDKSGAVKLGIFKDTIDNVNYEDYEFRSPMGLAIPKFLKKYAPNQFHFLGIMGPRFIVGMAVVDLKYLSNGFFYIYDREGRDLKETKKTLLGNKHVLIEPYPGRGKSLFDSTGLHIEMDRGRITAKGKDIELDITMDLSQVAPLRICTRNGYTGWSYTQKTVPISIYGELAMHGKHFSLSSPDYFALTDWTCGYMRRHTFWNWAAAASAFDDSRTFSMNFACGRNETRVTEHAFWVNSVITKVASMACNSDSHDLYKDWHVTSFDGKVDLTFHPATMRSENINAFAVASKFSQFVGSFDGKLITDTSEIIELKECPGYAEDHFARW